MCSTSNEGASLSCGARGRVGVVICGGLAFCAFIDSPIARSVVGPLAVVSSNVGKYSVVTHAIPFASFSMSSGPSDRTPGSAPRGQVVSVISYLVPHTFVYSVVSLLFV